MSVNLTLAAVGYDRFRALADGRVRPEGIDLTCLDLQVEEIFHRQIKHLEFDVSELSLSSSAGISGRRGGPSCIPRPGRLRCEVTYVTGVPLASD